MLISMVLKIDRTRSLKCSGKVLVIGASECVKLCLNWLTSKIRTEEGHESSKLLVCCEGGRPGYAVTDYYNGEQTESVLFLGGVEGEEDLSQYDLVFRVMRFYKAGVAVTGVKPLINQCWIVRANDYDELKGLSAGDMNIHVRLRRSGLDFPDNAEEFVTHPYRLGGKWTESDIDGLCDYLGVDNNTREKILEVNRDFT